jgi:hypothetical protein
MHAAKVAIMEADKAAMVSTYPNFFTFLLKYPLISSNPRDSGRVLLGLKLQKRKTQISSHRGSG